MLFYDLPGFFQFRLFWKCVPKYLLSSIRVLRFVTWFWLVSQLASSGDLEEEEEEKEEEREILGM